MLSHYLTVKENGENEIIVEKSRFIAHVSRAETEDEAQDFIQAIKKKHWNATHNCSAYIIGEHDQIQKANDDGEPSGTAGVPILEVLKKRKVKNSVVVITRYFGGIKLGAGGLIRAYGRATSEGLNFVGIVERKLVRVIKTCIDYNLLGKIENELHSSVYQIKEIHYTDIVEIDTFIESTQMDVFQNWMMDLANGQAKFRVGEWLYLENDVKKGN